MVRNDNRAEIQHYVPQLLLRGFLRHPPDAEQVFVFDKHEDRSFPTNIKNIAAERSFYSFSINGEQADIEGVLTDLESETRPILELLVNAESLDALDGEQRVLLLAFIATQFLRTRHFREVINTLKTAVAKRTRSDRQRSQETEGPRVFEMENDLKIESISHLATSIRPYTKLLSSKACFLAKTRIDRPFWTSDHPVVMHNDRDLTPYGNIGLAVPGIQIYLPLTSTLLLALWCPTIADVVQRDVERARRTLNVLVEMRGSRTDINPNEISYLIRKWQELVNSGSALIEALKVGSSVEASEDNVTFYNHLQVEWSHRYVISSTNQFALAKKMISDNVRYQRGLLPKID